MLIVAQRQLSIRLISRFRPPSPARHRSLLSRLVARKSGLALARPPAMVESLLYAASRSDLQVLVNDHERDRQLEVLMLAANRQPGDQPGGASSS